MIEPRAGFVHYSQEPLPYIGTYQINNFYTINTGLFLTRKKLNIGFSFHSINQPVIGTYDNSTFCYKKRNLNLYANYNIEVLKKIKISPVVDMSITTDYYIIKSYLLFSYLDKIILGYNFRSYSSTLFENGVIAGLNITNNLQVIGSYSKAGINSKYQLGLLIQFGKTKKDLTKWKNF